MKIFKDNTKVLKRLIDNAQSEEFINGDLAPRISQNEHDN